MTTVDTRLYSLGGDLGMLQGVLNSLASEGVTPAQLQRIRDDREVRAAVAEVLGAGANEQLTESPTLWQRYRFLVHALHERPGSLPPGVYMTSDWDWTLLSVKDQAIVAHYLIEPNFKALLDETPLLQRSVLLWVWAREGTVTVADIAQAFNLPETRTKRLYETAHHVICEVIHELLYDEQCLAKIGDAVLQVPIILLDLPYQITVKLAERGNETIRDLMRHNKSSLRDALDMTDEEVERICDRLRAVGIDLGL